MQTDDGQVVEPHSVSAGLDYPGIGPMHAHLFEVGRVKFVSATDDESLKAGIDLSRAEGIIPALESAHAIAALNKFNLTKTTWLWSIFLVVATKIWKRISSGGSISHLFQLTRRSKLPESFKLSGS